MEKLNYLYGLQQLETYLRKSGESQDLLQFGVLKNRLLTDLSEVQEYNDPLSKVDVNRVVKGLNQLSLRRMGIDFLGLCYSTSQEESKLSNEPLKIIPTLIQPLQGGKEVQIHDRSYLLYDPLIEEMWTPNRSAVLLKIRGRQLATNQQVWFKQVLIKSADPQALSLKSVLRKEARLLSKLERDQQMFFPRLIDEQESEEASLIAYVASQGPTLAQMYFRQSQQLVGEPRRQFLRVIQSVCGQLETLHRQNLAHRQISPEAILVVKNRPVFRDVGLATQPYGLGEGKAAYRAPEQEIRPQSLTVPGTYTDVYQIGILLYQGLTGQMPDISSRMLPPITWNNDISIDLNKIVLHTLETEGRRRPHISDIRRKLRQVLEQEKEKK